MDMKPIQKLQENVWIEIGKKLTLFKLKKEMGQAMKDLSEDPQVVSILQNIQYEATQLQKLLPDFCKRNPHSNLCKKYKK